MNGKRSSLPGGGSSRGVVFNELEGRFETSWGWIKIDLRTANLQVSGPGVNEWLDADRAIRTANLFVAHSPSIEWALALAIQGQFAAWQGLRSLPARFRN